MTVVIGRAANALTFAQAATEFYSRGFDYLNADAAGRTRAKRWLNQAYQIDIATYFPWSWLELQASGVAPLTISDVGQVYSVYDGTRKVPLQWADRRTLVQDYGDLTTVGTASSFYMEGTELNVYPVDSTTTYTVRYVANPAALSADADQPLFPSLFDSVWIDFAVVRAYRDSDNAQAAQELKASAYEDLERLVTSDRQNLSGTEGIRRVWGVDL